MNTHQAIEVYTAETLQDAGRKLAADLTKFATERARIVSLSHAYGPTEDDGNQWSVFVVVERVTPEPPQQPVLDRAV
jgi:hypothetical protein